MKWILWHIKGTIDIVWHSIRMLLVSKSVSDMLILTTQESSTNAGVQRNMCLHCPKNREILLSQSVQDSINRGQYLSLYNHKAYENKKTKKSEFGSETNSESNLETARSKSLHNTRLLRKTC